MRQDRQRQRDGGQPGHHLAGAWRDRRERQAAIGRLVADHVDVDLARVLDGRRADALAEDARPPRPSGAAEHQLGGVRLAGEVEQRARHLVADHDVHGGADAAGQLAHLAHLARRHPRQPVTADDVHHHQLRAGLRRDARSPAHQRFRLGSAGHRDDHPLAGFPGVGDLLVGAIFRQRGVDLIGKPQQRDLAQRGQVAGAEVIGQRRVDSFRRVHVSVSKPAPQRFRRDIDQFDLSRSPDDLVGHGLALFDSGDLSDDVVEAFQVLDIERRDHRDAGVQQRFDVLPTLFVGAARDVAVGVFVDERHFRLAAQHRLDVEFREGASAVGDVVRRNDFDAFDELVDLLAAVRFHDRCDDVGAALQPAMRLAEHGAGLADARGRAEVDPQLAPSLLVHPVIQRIVVRRRLACGGHPAIIHRKGQDFTGDPRSSSRFTASTLTTGSPTKPSRRPCWLCRTASRTWPTLMPRARATRATCSSA